MELVKWQKDFIKYYKIRNGNAILWCDTGLGKSVVATFITSRLKSGLIIVPPHLFSDWIGKLEAWDVPLDKINVIKLENQTYDNTKINIISVNRLALEKFKLKGLKEHTKDSIFIIDECHNVKNYKSNIFKKLDAIRDYFDYSLLLSATLIGKDTIDYFVYTHLVNNDFRHFFGTFNNFAKKNVEWDIIRLADGKSIPVPIKIRPEALEKYTYPLIYKQSYESAGVTKPTYNFKTVGFDFSESHNKMISDVKSKIIFDIDGKRVKLDDVNLENLTVEELEDLATKIHNKHPTFYQLMNCLQYEASSEFQVDTFDEIEKYIKEYNKKGEITYCNESQLKLLSALPYTYLSSKKRGDKQRFIDSDKLLYVTEFVQPNEKMRLTFEGDTHLFDMESKNDMLNSIMDYHKGQKGYLTYYFQGEGKYLESNPSVFVYRKDGDIEKFEKSDKKILATQISQIGEGIRLKFCDYMVEFSLFYNLIEVIQSRGRLGYANCNKIINIYSIIPNSKDTKKILDNIKNKLIIHTEEFSKKQL